MIPFRFFCHKLSNVAKYEFFGSKTMVADFFWQILCMDKERDFKLGSMKISFGNRQYFCCTPLVLAHKERIWANSKLQKQIGRPSQSICKCIHMLYQITFSVQSFSFITKTTTSSYFCKCAARYIINIWLSDHPQRNLNKHRIRPSLFGLNLARFFRLLCIYEISLKHCCQPSLPSVQRHILNPAVSLIHYCPKGCHDTSTMNFLRKHPQLETEMEDETTLG